MLREELWLDCDFGIRYLYVAMVLYDSEFVQVDEDGESYWVFESRDVGITKSFTLPISLTIA